jgi:protein-S-isoprenylcysteine O-methyltransferase Ste14
MNKLVSLIMGGIDASIYFFIGPFNVLYIIPLFFRRIESSFGIELQKLYTLEITGVILMWIGLIIAVWSATLMLTNSLSTIVPFFKPKALITSGPFSQVRHPMMWSLFIVLLGEALMYSSPLTFFWLLFFIRFSIIYIEKFEEPYLHSVFNSAYKKYSSLVPCWLPKCFANTRPSLFKETRPER